MSEGKDVKNSSEDSRRIDDLVESLTTGEPKPKEKGFEVSMREAIEARSEDLEALEHCGNIRGLTVCEGDEVTIYVGRYWFTGVVQQISKMGVVLVNQMHETAIALGKISFVTVLRRGEWYKRYRRIKPR